MQNVKRLHQRSAILALLCLAWGVTIVAGMYKVTVYSRSPGEAAPQPGQWPRGTTVPLAGDRPTMLLTLHPRCVCSRATLEELARLLAEISSPIRIQALMYLPEAGFDSWSESGLAKQARSIPGLTLLADVKGKEAERFGMSTSGHTALYAPDGRLLFSGGITSARGHVGDNAGHSAIVSILLKRQPATTRTPAFGCSIRDPK